MEFPHLGKQCAESSCQKLDFLPVKCDACEKIFCHEHMSYMGHNCASAYKKDVQVPVCPLCNKPIPVRRGESPDIAVGAHIDTDCQSDPAKNKRKVFTNKCSMKGCKGKEIVTVVCNECSLNFCLRHRHTADHKCQGRQAATRNLAALEQRMNKYTSVEIFEVVIVHVWPIFPDRLLFYFSFVLFSLFHLVKNGNNFLIMFECSHEHMSYMGHNCASAYKKDVQVPVCPLCNKPIPVRRGEPPDIAVGAHIDTDCQSDPAKNKRKVFTNKCSMKGCKGKEIVRVVCNECSLNFCLRHRHTAADHKCQGRQAATRNLAAQAATARLAAPTQTPAVASVQGSLSEDEALARAIQLSMMEEKHTNKSTTPEEQLAADAALARAIAESERTARRPITSNTPSNSRSNCAVS
ncbi:LOW QUALITY PROTEIN: AN1-type zinc finger protein 2B-like [Homalodisca vitripennis]|uniref:LOW QUALITY PROTEIN: AN1-type zinc finger protein 2B-like n=1 Tax=Homalodisca vitripennis TaxID=197043 RepID=UPI001EEA7692|nr:LOW QUALITY PROTEIN: AN1-type zinc finger protein 2B-like [Homalodisca vitripennis]